MKHYRIIFSLALLALFVLKPSNLTAQKIEKPFSIGASYLHSTNTLNKVYDKPTADRYKKNRVIYQGLSVDFAYRLRIVRKLIFHPGISFYVVKQKETIKYDFPVVTPGLDHYQKPWGTGVTLSLPIGLYAPSGKVIWELETGPTISAAFSKPHFWLGTDDDWFHNDVFIARPVVARWRFSIGLNLLKTMYIKANYDVTMTDYDIYGDKPGVISLGLGYNF